MEKGNSPTLKQIELPRGLVVDCLSRFVRPGQDPLLRKLVQLIVLNLSHDESPCVNSIGIYMALTFGCLGMQREAAAARSFLPLLVERIGCIEHPNARSFADAVREYSSKQDQERKRNVHPFKRR